ncbi:hypothetical protein [Streptomyces scopuliridis]|uniref:hypothetical protein n=1 Tax=Streptomyces scopuliridis TaxID=452529 RepID=UPI00368991D9
MTESRPEQPPGPGSNEPLRLGAAGAAASSWIAVLTTEHYNMQTQRAATISEANGRASIFLGALPAGLIALGFYGHPGHSAGTTTFYTLVLSSLAFLGVVTFIRCMEISIDDWQFKIRITRLRAIYAELVPELADPLLAVAGAEQAVAMLTPRRKPFQRMLSVAGSIGVITSVVIGADVGVLAYGLHAPLVTALPGGVTVGLVTLFASVRFQSSRWKGASATETSPGSI